MPYTIFDRINPRFISCSSPQCYHFRLYGIVISALFLLSLISCSKDDDAGSGDTVFILESAEASGIPIALSGMTTRDISLSGSVRLRFSHAVDEMTISAGVHWHQGDLVVTFHHYVTDDGRTLILTPAQSLNAGELNKIELTNALKSADGASSKYREISFYTVAGQVALINVHVDQRPMLTNERLDNVSLNPQWRIECSVPIDTQSMKSAVSINGPNIGGLNFSFEDEGKIIYLEASSSLLSMSTYELNISDQLKGANNQSFSGAEYLFSTGLDSIPKFPVIEDEELLTKIQRQTFKYFWEYGHPQSGLSRERFNSGDLVTIGGSGFGIMTIIVALKRGFITKEEAIVRWTTMIDFLANADRFHGAWPHWLNGATGKVWPFSVKDNGADLVETGLLVQGLITLRQFLLMEYPEEAELIDAIDQLWQEVEWSWFTKGEHEALYWHWSPNYEWDINLKIAGHNEAQIVYVLAASSPTSPIEAEVYHSGYARNGGIHNGRTFYSYKLPLGQDLGGPLFFAHYSYLGLDPRYLSDGYADYWTQNVNHTLINRAYCVDNPHNYVGYSDMCWGLTASDDTDGYAAHHPNHDVGVITPTAAISSLPYTPDESMQAIRFFYYQLGDRLWGEYGFHDAFHLGENWFSNSYLAIDQGPIICMIENHRSQLLWNLFMSAPEVQIGLAKLGFSF